MAIVGRTRHRPRGGGASRADGGSQPGEGQRRTVADVAVPERIGLLGLPLEPRRRALAIALRDLVKDVLTVQARHRRSVSAGLKKRVIPVRIAPSPPSGCP